MNVRAVVSETGINDQVNERNEREAIKRMKK